MKTVLFYTRLRILLLFLCWMPPASAWTSSYAYAQDASIRQRAQDRQSRRVQTLQDGLTAWKARFDKDRSWWGGAKAQLQALIAESLVVAEISPAALQIVANDLLTLGSIDLVSLSELSEEGYDSDVTRTRRMAIDALESLLDSELRERLAEYLGEVLASGERYPASQRYLAAHLCFAHQLVAGRQGMMTVAWDKADDLRPAILGILAQWPSAASDLFLVRLLGRKFDRSARPHPFTILLRRIRLADQPLTLRAATELALRLQVMLTSQDWRECSRAIELSQGLEPESRAPLLIRALSIWTKREKEGQGKRRLIEDLVQQLRAISGRSVGRNPRSWETWWSAVESGKVSLHTESSPDSKRSTASFFGLRAVSDRLTFVLDISGSMDTLWRTEKHSRYVEAIDQMMVYLQSVGEAGQFNVILFSSDTIRSSVELVPCTAVHLERARNSLLARTPIGGTHLRPAMELALGLDRRGNFNPTRLLADTIIVLCDGLTRDGKDWVKPLLERIQPEAQVRIHCVLVGTDGDGTLSALAQETGGDFIRID